MDDHDDAYLVDADGDVQGAMLETRTAPIEQLRRSPLYSPPLAVRVGWPPTETDREVQEALALSIGREYGILPPTADLLHEPTLGVARWQVELWGDVVAAGERGDAALAALVRPAIEAHLHELVTRDTTVDLLEYARLESPATVAELVPHRLDVGTLRNVLQLLLRERVPLKPVPVMLGAVADHARTAREPHFLAEQARLALWRVLRRRAVQVDGELRVLRLASGAESAIGFGLHHHPYSGAAQAVQLGSDVANRLEAGLAAQVTAHPDLIPQVLLVPDHLRRIVARFYEERHPDLTVLSDGEVSRMGRHEVVAEVAADIVAPAMPPMSMHPHSPHYAGGGGVWSEGTSSWGPHPPPPPSGYIEDAVIIS